MANMYKANLIILVIYVHMKDVKTTNALSASEELIDDIKLFLKIELTNPKVFYTINSLTCLGCSMLNLVMKNIIDFVFAFLCYYYHWLSLVLLLLLLP